MQSIKRLPRSVNSSLRSSIILSDLPRVVEELIYNSIDAGASKVDILVNVKACYVKVEDDGCGITRDDLVVLGEKYTTSKFHHVVGDEEPSSGSFGLKGEALGSLSDISVVEVRTKARGRPNSYCKIIKGSKCLYLGIDDQREIVGTTVIVRELFYNQPVRRKYMQSSHKRELHCVKKCVLRVALVYPQVSFRLLDIESQDELLCTVPSASSLPLVSDGFGNDVSSCLHEIASSDQDWILSGHISGPTDAFSTKVFQYLYINSRFVNRSPIHDMLNSLAATFQCSVVKRSDEIDLQSRKRQKTAGYPAYLLNLCCPRSSYDLNFEPSKTVVEFKDWHNVLFFLEQTITNYWKQLVLQPPKEKAADDKTGTPVKTEGKSNMGLLKCCSAWKKEDCVDLYRSSTQQNAVENGNVSRSAVTVPKDLCSFSMDFKPCTRNIGDWADDALPHISSVARNDLDLVNNQMHSFNCDSYQWLDDGPFWLEDCGLSNVNSTVRKKRRTGNLLRGNWHSNNFGMLEDVTTKSVLADDREFEINAEEIQFREPCFGALNRPHTVNCNFLENKSNRKAHNSTDSGFGAEFDKLNEDCLLDKVTEAIADISDPEMSHFTDRFYHEDGGTSRGFCSAIKKCTRNKKSEILCGYDEVYATVKSNFRDMKEMWGNDYMDGSSDKDLCPDFSHPFSSPYVACSHTRTCLESDRRSYGSFDYWHCGKMDSDFRFSWDRISEDSPVSRGEFQLFNNFKRERHKAFDFSFNELISEDDQITRKSKVESRFACSPENSITDCHLNPASSQMPNDSMVVEGLSNQQYVGCSRTSQFCKGRPRRSLSAPPFYRSKCKFSRLNDYLTTLTGETDKYLSGKSSAETKCSPKAVSNMNATQPIPEPTSSEFSELNFSLNGKLKMHETMCSDELEDATAEITKWRDDSDQHTGPELSHGPSECNDDVLNICSGPLHLSGSSLVPECIDKNCFEEARVLLQLDKKFIPVISRETVIIVDQHAADERIRLEELRNKVLSGEGRGITYLDPEEDLALPEMGFQLFLKYAEQIQKWGWISNTCCQSSEPFKKNMNILRRQARVVTLVAVPCILGINLTGKDLIEFIEQLVETDGSSTLPPAVLRILNFKACRGAIMFGDSLLPSECSLIIEELKATSLCFQCAHGRPTTVPLVNIASLRKELARFEMLNGKPSETWHGLSRHIPSLERAQTRLKRLKRLCGGG